MKSIFRSTTFLEVCTCVYINVYECGSNMVVANNIEYRGGSNVLSMDNVMLLEVFTYLCKYKYIVYVCVYERV